MASTPQRQPDLRPEDLAQADLSLQKKEEQVLRVRQEAKVANRIASLIEGEQTENPEDPERIQASKIMPEALRKLLLSKVEKIAVAKDAANTKSPPTSLADTNPAQTLMRTLREDNLTAFLYGKRAKKEAAPTSGYKSLRRSIKQHEVLLDELQRLRLEALRHGKDTEASIYAQAMTQTLTDMQAIESDLALLRYETPEAYYASHALQLRDYARQARKGRIVETPWVQEKLTMLYAAVLRGEHVFLGGPLGCGKTEALIHLCKTRLKKEPYVVTCSKHMDESELTVEHILESTPTGSQTKTILSKAYRAANEGRPLIVDEITLANPQVLGVLNYLLTRKVEETFQANGDSGLTVTVQPGFTVLASGNIGKQYVGVQEQNIASLDRFTKYHWDFLPNSTEISEEAERTEGTLGDEAYHVLATTLMTREAEMHDVPTTVFTDLKRLARGARIIQDIFMHKRQLDQFFDNASHAHHMSLSKSVLSMRSLLRIVKTWRAGEKREGATRMHFNHTLDEIVFEQVIVPADEAERKLVYMLLKTKAGFFANAPVADLTIGAPFDIDTIRRALGGIAMPDLTDCTKRATVDGVFGTPMGHIPERTHTDYERILRPDAKPTAEPTQDPTEEPPVPSLFGALESQLEKHIHLKEQYEVGVVVLQKRQGLLRQKKAGGTFETVSGEVGVITKLSTGVEGIIGIDNKEYPTPTYDQLARHINERCSKEPAFAHKFKQGLTRMVLEPFAAPVHHKALLYESILLEKHGQGALYRAQPDPKATPPDSQKITQLHAKRAFYANGEYTTDGSNNENGTGVIGVDLEGKLLYEPTGLQKNGDQWQVIDGKTKAQMLADSTTTFPGWNVYFIEDDPTISKKDEIKQSGSGRTAIQAGKSPQQYMTTMQTDAQYALEAGMTLDSWLTFAACMADQHGQVVDDYEGTGRACFLTGSVFSSGRVPFVFWDRLNVRAFLNWDYPDNVSEDDGLRPAVKT